MILPSVLLVLQRGLSMLQAMGMRVFAEETAFVEWPTEDRRGDGCRS